MLAELAIDENNLIGCRVVLGKWVEFSTVLRDFAVEAVADLFARLKYIIGDKINNACSNDDSLPAYDIKIYDSYKRILAAYALAIDIHDDPAKVIITPCAKEIWDGIHAVLVSRLPVAEVGENPIDAEKTTIVTAAILDALAQLDNFAYQATLDAKVVAPQLADTSIETLRNFSESIITERAAAIYEVYSNTANTALERLNDISSRHNVSHYMKLLTDEQEILRQILVVQVMALESLIKDADSGINAHEAAVLQEALGILRETHQREGAAISHINELFSTGRNAAILLEENCFSSNICAIAAFGENSDMVLTDFADRLNGRHAAYRTAAANLLTQQVTVYHDKHLMERMYFCSKAVSELERLTRETCDCFRAIIAHFEAHKDDLAANPGFDIIAGVAETITIKLESLHNGIADFMQDSEGCINDFPQNHVGMSDEVHDAFITYLGHNLAALPSVFDISALDAPLAVQGIIEDFLLDDEMTAHHDLIGRNLTKQEAGFDKIVIGFKRDCLLFELTTFEEIMFYSVSRLRESDVAAVAAFVATIDEQHKALADILTKYGIDKISPVAHDPFNPKENEVLMAEVNPDFKKGTIIKTMNAGYRQGDIVLVRANVIAAR